MHPRVAPVLILLLAACEPIDDDRLDTCSPTCSGDTLCIEGLCEPAFPRSYQLTLEVAMGSEDPDGECWDDPLCGEPDPIAIVTIDGREVGRTPEADDTFSHRWIDDPIVVRLETDSVLTLEVIDSDVDLDDLATRCQLSPVTAEMLRTGELSCSVGFGETRVAAAVEPL